MSRPALVACLAAILLALGCASGSSSTSSTAAKTTPPPAPTGGERTADLALSEPGAPALDPVYFETDRALLDASARATLKSYATAIQQHPEWGTLTIEGHCDERGSDEYNLVLGNRRAGAVASYLADLGVPASRLKTRTFGEARPAVAGHSEAAWSKNRRTELQSEAKNAANR